MSVVIIVAIVTIVAHSSYVNVNVYTT